MSSKIIVISAPSGTGKTTVVKELLKRKPKMSLSISCTTRSPRPSEQDGKDYYFISDKKFQEMIEENEFVEWANVHNCRYGTPKSGFRDSLNNKKDIILDIDVQGGRKIKDIYPDAILIFLLPPSFKVLEDRLRGRGTNNGPDFERRISNAKQELKAKDDYDFQVINDHLEKTVDEIINILEKHD